MRYKNILIWEVNWIGDVLFSTPFIKALRKRFPDARITCITVPSCKPLLDVNPNVDEVLVFDEKNGDKYFSSKIKMILRIMKGKYNVSFLLHRSRTRALMCLIGGVKQRIGYSYPKRNFLMTHKIKTPLSQQHRIEYYLGLARKIGADTEYTGMDFYTTAEDEKKVAVLFKQHKINKSDVIVAVNPGGNWDLKRWPIEKYALLCDMLIGKLNVKVVVTGAGKDVDLYLKMQERMEHKAVSLCGKTSIRQIGSVFKRANLVISADSGPLHAALALKRKCLALFGPTSPAITGPYGDGDYAVIQKDVGCEVPCYDLCCDTNKCMDAIEPKEVFERARIMLNR